MKHGDGSIMVWACFAASGPGQPAIIDGTMNSELYQQILKENVKISVHELSLMKKWVMQQYKDPKHTSRSTKEWLKNKVNVLEWLSQSPDLNPIKMLLKDSKQAVHGRKPTNITELKRFCTEEWAKIPTSCCAGLISKKRYLQLLLQKGVTPDTESKDSHTFATDRCVTMVHFSQ